MRYRSAIFVPGRKRPWTEESESEAGCGPGDCLKVVAMTVAAPVASNKMPHAEQRWLVSEFSIPQAGQVFIVQFRRPAVLRSPGGTGFQHERLVRLNRPLRCTISVLNSRMIMASLRRTLFTGVTDTLNHNAAGRIQKTGLPACPTGLKKTRGSVAGSSSDITMLFSVVSSWNPAFFG